MKSYLYEQLELWLREAILSGQHPIGSRMPSVRQCCEQRQVSKSTVLTAYSRLEAEGLLEARPRSGYFVSNRLASRSSLTTPAPSKPVLTPTPVSATQVLVDIMEQGAAFDLLTNSPKQSGNEQLRRSLSRAQRLQSSKEQHYYDEPCGHLGLRQQLQQRLALGGSQIEADQLLITAGCQHALLLALMATTQPGDVVALESPGFYGALQLLETLGLQALELPTSVELGISPNALELALEHWDIKAIMLSPAYATPTGACMPDSHKQRILELAVPRNIAIIEDDIYGELFFGLQRPRTLHSFDDSGSVLLCSSFSKNLSRDLRVGWIAPGRYLDAVKRLKLVTALASSQTLQQGIFHFLEQGGYDRHLRQQRQLYRQQCQQLLQFIPHYLPNAKACSQPNGGLALWLELPEHLDTLKLYNKAKQQGLMITPGRLFTAQERYHNYLRLSFAHPWSEVRIQALQKLGNLLISN